MLIGCGCGRRFLQRLDRPVVACFRCGRLRDLGPMIGRLRAASEGEENRAPKAALRTREVA
jgi:hypothetical protein